MPPISHSGSSYWTSMLPISRYNSYHWNPCLESVKRILIIRCLQPVNMIPVIESQSFLGVWTCTSRRLNLYFWVYEVPVAARRRGGRRPNISAQLVGTWGNHVLTARDCWELWLETNASSNQGAWASTQLGSFCSTNAQKEWDFELSAESEVELHTMSVFNFVAMSLLKGLHKETLFSPTEGLDFDKCRFGRPFPVPAARSPSRLPIPRLGRPSVRGATQERLGYLQTSSRNIYIDCFQILPGSRVTRMHLFLVFWGLGDFQYFQESRFSKLIDFHDFHKTNCFPTFLNSWLRPA